MCFSQNAIRDEVYKFKIMELVVYHRDNCVNAVCVCKWMSFRDDKN